MLLKHPRLGWKEFLLFVKAPHACSPCTFHDVIASRLAVNKKKVFSVVA